MRLDFAEELDEHGSMGVGGVGEQTCVLYLIYGVGTVGENLIFDSVELVAYHDSFEFHTQTVGQSAAFGKELEAHIGNTAFVVFAVDYEVIIVCHCDKIGKKALADGMVDDELFDKFFNLLVVVFETTAFFGGEYHILDSLYFSRRTGETNL